MLSTCSLVVILLFFLSHALAALLALLLSRSGSSLVERINGVLRGGDLGRRIDLRLGRSLGWGKDLGRDKGLRWKRFGLLGCVGRVSKQLGFLPLALWRREFIS